MASNWFHSATVYVLLHKLYVAIDDLMSFI